MIDSILEVLYLDRKENNGKSIGKSFLTREQVRDELIWWFEQARKSTKKLGEENADE